MPNRRPGAIGVAVAKFDQANHDREVSALRTHLGSAEFFAAWGAGHVRSLEEAIVEAIFAVDELVRVTHDVNPLDSAGETS